MAKWTKVTIGYRDVHGEVNQKIQAKVLAPAVQFILTCAILSTWVGHVLQAGSWIGKQFAKWDYRAVLPMHTINQGTWLQALSAKLVYLAVQAELVFTDLQVKQDWAVAPACLNAIFYVYVMADLLTAVMARQVHHWHFHHAYWTTSLVTQVQALQ
jgi:hypothetical protein